MAWRTVAARAGRIWLPSTSLPAPAIASRTASPPAQNPATAQRGRLRNERASGTPGGEQRPRAAGDLGDGGAQWRRRPVGSALSEQPKRSSTSAGR